MTAVQRILKAVLPRSWGESVESDSRAWRCYCTRCATDSGSVWDRGGIRWRAAGNPRVAARCRACGNSWARLIKDEQHEG